MKKKLITSSVFFIHKKLHFLKMYNKFFTFFTNENYFVKFFVFQESNYSFQFIKCFFFCFFFNVVKLINLFLIFKNVLFSLHFFTFIAL